MEWQRPQRTDKKQRLMRCGVKQIQRLKYHAQLLLSPWNSRWFCLVHFAWDKGWIFNCSVTYPNGEIIQRNFNVQSVWISFFLCKIDLLSIELRRELVSFNKSRMWITLQTSHQKCGTVPEKPQKQEKTIKRPIVNRNYWKVVVLFNFSTYIKYYCQQRITIHSNFRLSTIYFWEIVTIFNGDVAETTANLIGICYNCISRASAVQISFSWNWAHSIETSTFLKRQSFSLQYVTTDSL